MFGTRLFPMGIPNEATLYEFWYMQKVIRGEENDDTWVGDNVIDYMSASQSLIDYFNSEEQ